MVLGQFIEQQKNLVEIVDVNQLQLQLSVFEKEIGKLKAGQNILFKTMGETDATHTALLTSISKTIDPVSKTIVCLAKITEKKGMSLVNRSFIEARITVNQKETNALPSEAILKSGKDYFVYVVEKSDSQSYFLRRQKIEIGKTSNGFTEIIGNPDFRKVLIKGVYNLPV
jgi:cobalt-zinc-cadmium efflux system membrane fusion protein